MPTLRVSFIASTFNRPEKLKRLIECLKAQTEPSWELLIMDESPDFYSETLLEENIHPVKCERFNDWGYSVKELGVARAKGEYLCFPADDAQYEPTFITELLALNVDLAYCDFICNGIPLGAQPETSYIDVGGFLVKKDCFKGWVNNGDCGDGRTVEKWIKEGITHAKVPEYLYQKE